MKSVLAYHVICLLTMYLFLLEFKNSLLKCQQAFIVLAYQELVFSIIRMRFSCYLLNKVNI
jgi:hypothetical protein